MAFDAVTMAVLEEIVDESVSKLEPGYTYKGSVAAVSNLPSSGNTKGDLWQVREDGSEWVWDGSLWVRRTMTPMTTAFIDSLFA